MKTEQEIRDEINLIETWLKNYHKEKNPNKQTMDFATFYEVYLLGLKWVLE